MCDFTTGLNELSSTFVADKLPPEREFSILKHGKQQSYLNHKYANLQKYAGSIEPTEDQNTMVYYSLQQRNEQEIKYSVHFPIQNPLPQLIKLTVNNEVICSQNPRTIIKTYIFWVLKLKIYFYRKYRALLYNVDVISHPDAPNAVLSNKLVCRPTPCYSD